MFIAVFNKISPCLVQYQTSSTVAIQKCFFAGRDIGQEVTVERGVGIYPFN